MSVMFCTAYFKSIKQVFETIKNPAKNIVGILILSGNQCNCRWCQSWILSLFPDHSWFVTIHSRWFTVFENHRKDLIQHCKASYVYILRRQMLKMVNFGEFFNPEACSHTVLPDRSILIGQKFISQMPKMVSLYIFESLKLVVK